MMQVEGCPKHEWNKAWVRYADPGVEVRIGRPVGQWMGY